MNIKKQLSACLAVAVGLSALTGCTRNQPSKLANEVAFSLDGISEVTISFDEEKVTLYESTNDKLILKEYMTENQSGYYARVDQNNDSIKIHEGRKPFFKNSFSRYIEVYLPASYHENLIVTTTSGDIDISEAEMSLNALRLDSTSGTIQLSTGKAQSIHLSTTSGILDVGCLDAHTIRIDTTSGNFSCEKLKGNVTYTATSGNADVRSAIGSGNYTVNNLGELNVDYTEVTGDLTFFNKNGRIHVTLPADLEFVFEAATKNGSISTAFPEYVSTQEKTTSGTVGVHPTVTVKAETRNGNIDITQ